MKLLTLGPRTVGGPVVRVLPEIKAMCSPDATDENAEQEDEMINFFMMWWVVRVAITKTAED